MRPYGRSARAVDMKTPYSSGSMVTTEYLPSTAETTRLLEHHSCGILENSDLLELHYENSGMPVLYIRNNESRACSTRWFSLLAAQFSLLSEAISTSIWGCVDGESSGAALLLKWGYLFSVSRKIPLSALRHFRVSRVRFAHKPLGIGRWRETLYCVEVVTVGSIPLIPFGDITEAVAIVDQLNSLMRTLRQNSYVPRPPRPVISCSDDLRGVAIRTINNTSGLLSRPPSSIQVQIDQGHITSASWNSIGPGHGRALIKAETPMILWITMLWLLIPRIILGNQMMKHIMIYAVGIIIFFEIWSIGYFLLTTRTILFIRSFLRHGSKAYSGLDFTVEEVRYWSAGPARFSKNSSCKVAQAARIQFCGKERGRNQDQDVMPECESFDGRQFGLRIMSHKYNELLAIEHLTEEEALYLAHVLIEKYPALSRGSLALFH